MMLPSRGDVVQGGISARDAAFPAFHTHFTGVTTKLRTVDAGSPTNGSPTLCGLDGHEGWARDEGKRPVHRYLRSTFTRFPFLSTM